MDFALKFLSMVFQWKRKAIVFSSYFLSQITHFFFTVIKQQKEKGSYDKLGENCIQWTSAISSHNREYALPVYWHAEASQSSGGELLSVKHLSFLKIPELFGEDLPSQWPAAKQLHQTD